MKSAATRIGLLGLLLTAAPLGLAAQAPPSEQELLARMSRQPQEITTYLDLAKLYTGAQRYAEAEDMLARATALVRAAKSQAAARTALSAAEQELQARVAASPGTIGHHLALAQFYADAGRTSDAEQALSRAMELVRRARLGPAAAAGGSTPVRVGGGIAEPKKIADVKPVYPAEALQSKVQGVVILEAIIDAGGAVRDAKVLRGVPMLDQAALDAVRQWRFTPTLLNGVPQEVIMTVTVSFTLSGN
jgi:TonB family protein